MYIFLDPVTHALTLLGTLPLQASTEHAHAILRIEKTALSVDSAELIVPQYLENTKRIEGTDIVSGQLISVRNMLIAEAVVYMAVRMVCQIRRQSGREDQHRAPGD